MTTWADVAAKAIEAAKFLVPILIGAAIAIWGNVFGYLHSRAKEKRERRLAALDEATMVLNDLVDWWMAIPFPSPTEFNLAAMQAFVERCQKSEGMRMRRAVIKVFSLDLGRAATALSAFTDWEAQIFTIPVGDPQIFFPRLKAHLNHLPDRSARISIVLKREYRSVEDAGFITPLRERWRRLREWAQIV